MGMILGNVFTLTGWDFFDFLRTMPFVKMISYFGMLILLFTAGLNTDLRALLRVGTSSFLVCLGGIIAPAGLALIVGHFLLPDTSSGTKLLLAIILCNTGTGLLVAVLKELKAMNTLEGRVITGAASAYRDCCNFNFRCSKLNLSLVVRGFFCRYVSQLWHSNYSCDNQFDNYIKIW